MPFSVGQQTVIFPGFDGGAEWGGQAFDPDTGLYYVNANDLRVDRRPGAEHVGQNGARRSTCRSAPPAIATICRARRPRFASLVGIGERSAGCRYQRSSSRARAACPDSRTCRPRRAAAVATS